jgi:uncharacterized protein (DUF4415 family)
MAKKPKNTYAPRPSKTAHSVEVASTSDQFPVWQISRFDTAGPWGRAAIDEDHLWGHIFEKLRHYEKMKWADIERDRRKNHSHQIAALSKEARQRAADIRLDADVLFRFRFTGEQRLWGIRRGRVFQIVWWDPHHQVYPTEKRRT